ncbi:hypothetical protein Taiwan894_07720 [Helicobacter pylori]
MQKFFSRFRRWALPFYFVSALAAIDIDEVTEAQANSIIKRSVSKPER